MADRQFVTIERRGGVALVRLDRPKVNALSIAVLDEIGHAVAELASDPPGAVVLWGGERVFAAGADINEVQSEAGPVEVPAAFRRNLDALAALPRLTIAAVNGVALGGGCELTLACDLRIAADNARFGQPEVLLGIVPGGGATQRLTRAVGPARAKELILTGRPVSAEEALAIGLVQRVVAPDQVLEVAMELAAGVATGALQAQAMSKLAIDQGLEIGLSKGLDLEQRLFGEALGTEDGKIGLRSFIENGPGKASFTGR